MLPYYLTLVSTSVLIANTVNGFQTGILVTLGSLLFVFGTVLRRKLPAPDETTSSHASTRPVDRVPPNTYVGTVAGVVVNTAASQRHANAVSVS